MTPETIRRQIAELVQQYARVTMAPETFEPGKIAISPSAKVIAAPELRLMLEAAQDGWSPPADSMTPLTRTCARVWAPLTAYHQLGLLGEPAAVGVLTSPKLGDCAPKPGDQAIIVPGGSPTTVNPLVIEPQWN